MLFVKTVMFVVVAGGEEEEEEDIRKVLAVLARATLRVMAGGCEGSRPQAWCSRRAASVIGRRLEDMVK